MIFPENFKYNNFFSFKKLHQMNKYEILGVVGEGAYGVVLKCRNKETGEVGELFLLYKYIWKF